MNENNDFTQGNIGGQIVRFAAPVMLTLFLQSLYGAVDLIIVGRFGEAADVSAVATGTAVMATITYLITALSVGSTVVIGHAIGAGRPGEAGRAMGTSIVLFFSAAVLISVIMNFAAEPFARALNAPEAAFAGTVSYTLICSNGAVFIVYYNLVGSVFRGFGDSKTPLFTVACATVLNIVGDLVLVGRLGMGPRGAAFATVFAQACSVLISVLIVKRRGLPFDFERSFVRWNSAMVKRIIRVGGPLSLQDGLVSLSFLFIAAIVNSLGLIASAGVGVAEKLMTVFILVPISAEQSLAAYVAQNYGAGKLERAKQAFCFTARLSTLICIALAVFIWIFRVQMSAFFSPDAAVVGAASEYMAAFGFDMMTVPLLFCFIGYFNGRGETGIVMVQGILGALAVRVPLSYLFAHMEPASLFLVGIATPISDVVTILLCIWYFVRITKRDAGGGTCFGV